MGTYLAAALGGAGLAFFPTLYRATLRMIEVERVAVFSLLFVLFGLIALAFFSPGTAVTVILLRLAGKVVLRHFGTEVAKPSRPLLADAVSPELALRLKLIEEEALAAAQKPSSDEEG